jgi:4'-phosphopantetheinyl transferase
VSWDPGPHRPEVDEGTVHVWRHLDRTGAAGWAGAPATSEDRAAAAARRFGDDAAALLLRRAMVRDVVGRYLGLPPTAVALTRLCRWCGDPRHGKPRLADNPSRLSFSASQAGGVTIVAVATGCEIGADVEQVGRAPDWALVAEQQFTPRERADLAAVPEPERPLAFLRTWAVKEACLKADGRGLVAGLDSVEVVAGHRASPWHVTTFSPAPGAVAAVASDQPVARIIGWDWESPVVAGDQVNAGNG